MVWPGLPVTPTTEVMLMMRPIAAAHHRMRQLAGQPEHRGQVDLQHRVPVGVRHAHEQAVLGDAGIVDEDVDAFELGLGLLRRAP